MSEQPIPEQPIPEEFKKIIKDFINDIRTTFPEYEPFVTKWWKSSENMENMENMENEEEREAIIAQIEKNNMNFIFNFCLKRYPPRFFDILYQNNEIFNEDSEIETEFLPYIHFKNLWQCDITEKTRETIWKYLQLILFSIVGSVENRDAFGDTSKLFEAINEDEFKSKLEETLNGMQDIFKNQPDESGDNTDGFKGMPDADHIHGHISGMLDGKLGKLAKEIAEETAADLNVDMEGATNVNDVFQKLFKNPGKLMSLVKNVGNKLESRMKSGEIKESELISEASEIINKMKNMPGMGDIQQMLSKMGMGGLGKGGKLDLNAMETKLNETMKAEKMKERMREKVKQKKTAAEPSIPVQQSEKMLSEDELIALFGDQHKSVKSDKKKKKGKGKENK